MLTRYAGWTAGRDVGSIVVISSMSSQIYNQSALNEPLRHVSPGRLFFFVHDGLCRSWAAYAAGLLQLVQGGRL